MSNQLCQRDDNMKKIAVAAMAIIMLPQICKAQDLSGWALEDFNGLSSKGILSSDIVMNELSTNITRGEFCGLITNIYETENTVTLSDKDRNIFNDTEDEAVLKAYKLGIVSGKGDGGFYPSDMITRQEMAVMISRLLSQISDEYIKYANQVNGYNANFADSGDTAQWAIEDMAAVWSCGIITGNDNNRAEPNSNATREQAICMLNRVYCDFIVNQTSYQVPVITSFSDEGASEHRLSVKWSYTPNVKEYRVIIKQKGNEPKIVFVGQNKLSASGIDTGMEKSDKITVYIAAYLNNGKQIFSSPLTVAVGEATENSDFSVLDSNISTAQKDNIQSEQKDNTTSENTQNSSSVSNPFNVIDYDKKTVLLSPKEQRVFPDGYYFKTEEEARAHMTEVTVPVWTLQQDGTKTTSQKTITVNSALAEDVINIFNEIYNDSTQFPIKDVGGFNWRNTAGGSVSQHSYGTCIDINYNENYYVRPDGTPITGSNWKPGEDPYSIAEDSIVVETFAKYEWKWGGNAWSDAYAKDYMHFTFLGK